LFLGFHLQRLFSMFPNGWPGRGLLVLRLTAGSLLVHDGIGELLRKPTFVGSVQQTLLITAGVFLLVGFCTPVTGISVVALQIWIVASHTSVLRNCIVSAVLGAAMTMLGPGIHSIDARLFGRKRIDIPNRHGGSGPPQK
jgi:putative oxidoreductase